jgi:hypothetical protein
MQVIKFFSGPDKVIADDEAENVKRMWMQDSSEPIRLRDGAVINPKGIVSVDEPETIATWWGYVLDKGGKSFMRDGERVYLEPHNFREIEYRLHPKYGMGTPMVPAKPMLESAKEGESQIGNILSEKFRIGSGLRTSAQEEAAMMIRNQ